MTDRWAAGGGKATRTGVRGKHFSHLRMHFGGCGKPFKTHFTSLFDDTKLSPTSLSTIINAKFSV